MEYLDNVDTDDTSLGLDGFPSLYADQNDGHALRERSNNSNCESHVTSGLENASNCLR